MRNKYINDRTGKFGPDLYYQRKIHHEQICSSTDKMIHEKNKSNIKLSGPREIFLKEYHKSGSGYMEAKAILDSKYGPVFSHENLVSWLGIENLRQILFFEYKENGIQKTYEKAEKINKKIGCKVLKKEDIDKIISEEIQKENERIKSQNKSLDEDAR